MGWLGNICVFCNGVWLVHFLRFGQHVFSIYFPFTWYHHVKFIHIAAHIFEVVVVAIH